MNQRISVSVDVTKIDKKFLVPGQKGTYLDLILIPTDTSKFGDHYLVKQNIKTEFLPAGSKGVIIGNARNLTPKSDDIPF